MTIEDRELVTVYRKSTGQKLPFPLPRAAVPLNPDLEIAPSSKAVRAGKPETPAVSKPSKKEETK